MIHPFLALLLVMMCSPLTGFSVSAAADGAGTPPQEVPLELPAPTAENEIQFAEPTAEPVLPPSETEVPVPAPTQGVIPTELPAPTEPSIPTPEPTVRPINTDSLVPDSDFGEIRLEQGQSATVSFTYVVTTPRQGTTVWAELRDDQNTPAAGWMLTIASLGVGGDGSTATGTDTSARNAGSSFPLTFTIQAPPTVEVAQPVTLHIWSTATLADGVEEAGIPDDGLRASLVAVPPPATPTPEVDESIAASPSPQSEPGFTATPIVSDSDSVSRSIQIAAESGSITNHNGFGLLGGMECVASNPTNLAITTGGSQRITCNIRRLVTTLGALGIVVGTSNFSVSSSNGNWNYTISGSPSQNGSIVNIANAVVIDGLLMTASIPLVFTPLCAVPPQENPYTFTVTSNFLLVVNLALGKVEIPFTYTSTVNIVVQGSTTPPTISVSGEEPVGFGTYAWNGSSYPSNSASITLIVGPPVVGCSASEWHVDATAVGMKRSGDTNYPIQTGALQFTGTSLCQSPPGCPTGPFAEGTSKKVVASSSPVNSGTQSATISLSMQPPNTAPAGEYSGTITFTTSSGL